MDNLIERFAGHVHWRRAEEVAFAARMVAEYRERNPTLRPTLVWVNNRLAEALYGYDDWVQASCGVVAVRMLDTNEIERFTPEMWISAQPEWVTYDA